MAKIASTSVKISIVSMGHPSLCTRGLISEHHIHHIHTSILSILSVQLYKTIIPKIEQMFKGFAQKNSDF